MAESRRKKKIPATFRFLHWQCRQCCDHRPLGSGAMLAPWLGSMPALGFRAMPAPGSGHSS